GATRGFLLRLAFGGGAALGVLFLSGRNRRRRRGRADKQQVPGGQHDEEANRRDAGAAKQQQRQGRRLGGPARVRRQRTHGGNGPRDEEPMSIPALAALARVLVA